MNEKSIKALENIGLSKKEILVYLACLELGKASTIQIAQKTQLKRTTAYSVINSLLEKRMLSKFQDEKGQKFSAESPDKLLAILQQKQDMLAEAIPNLLTITKAESNIRPEVKFYQGIEGIKTVYEDTLASCNKGDEILCYASAKDLYNIMPDYINNYVARRKDKGITTRVITPGSEATKKYAKRDKNVLRKMKVVNENEMSLSIDKKIYKDKIVLTNLRGFLFGIIIKSPQIAKSEKEIFELLWKKLPEK